MPTHPGQPSPDIYRKVDHLISSGRFSEAALVVLEALAVDDAMAGTAVKLAIAQARAKELRQANAFTARALQLRPNNIDLINCQVALLRNSGKAEEAAALCQRAIQVNSQAPAAHANLGLCYLAIGDPRAAASLARAHELQPEDASVLSALAMAFKQQRRLTESAAALRQVIALAPDVVAPYKQLAELAVLLEKPKEAVTCLRKITELLPSNAAAKADLATMLIDSDELEEAGQVLAEAVALDPESASIHSLIGRFSQLKGRFSDAIYSFEKSISINPRDVAAYGHLPFCKTLVEEDRSFLEKAALLADTPELKPSQAAQLHFAIGKGLDDLSDYEGALRHYDVANAKALQERISHGESFSRASYRQAYDEAKMIFTPTFAKDQKSLASHSKVPIFIVGMLRSGTTLVEQILSSHKEVAAGGEIPFWASRAEELFDNGRFSALKAENAIRDYLKELRYIAGSGQRVTDKLPSNVIHLGLLYALFPKAKAILCQRDPVDVALSIYKTPNRGAPMFAHRREDIVFALTQTSQISDHWLSILPKEWLLRIQYEDLIADSETHVRNLIQFCGLAWDDACLQHEKNDRVVKTPSFWQVKQPIYSSSVGRWRRYEPWLGPFSKLIERA